MWKRYQCKFSDDQRSLYKLLKEFGIFVAIIVINIPSNIVQGLIIDDEETYIFLFREYYVSLCSYARRYLGRKDIAEEIVSDVFFRIWENRMTDTNTPL